MLLWHHHSLVVLLELGDLAPYRCSRFPPCCLCRSIRRLGKQGLDLVCKKMEECHRTALSSNSIPERVSQRDSNRGFQDVLGVESTIGLRVWRSVHASFRRLACLWYLKFAYYCSLLYINVLPNQPKVRSFFELRDCVSKSHIEKLKKYPN